MLTDIIDAFEPNRRPEKRPQEPWLTVDTQRACAAYAKGAAALRAVHAATGQGSQGGTIRALTLRRIAECESMARALSVATGLTTMPASEVGAWLALEDGSTAAALWAQGPSNWTRKGGVIRAAPPAW